MAKPMPKTHTEREEAAPEKVVHVETGLVLAHEDRLQYLEKSQIQIAAQLAEGSSMMRNLREAIDGGFERVEKRQAEMGEQVAALVKSNTDRDEKIKAVTEVVAQRSRTMAWIKLHSFKIILGMLAAAGGVFGRAIGEFFSNLAK